VSGRVGGVDACTLEPGFTRLGVGTDSRERVTERLFGLLFAWKLLYRALRPLGGLVTVAHQ